MAKSYPFKLGNLNCASLYDNDRQTKLRDVFPSVSDEVFNQVVNEHGFSQEIANGFNVLYIQKEDKHILIDSGFGSAHLSANLQELGLTPQAITHIIVTHNDGDHIGGLKDFPNAEIIMPKHSWELWANPETRASMVEEFIMLFRGQLPDDALQARAASREQHGSEVLPSLKERLRLIEANEEIFSGIRFVEAFGHRSDHYAVELSSEGETLLHVADSIKHPVQMNHDWVGYIDSYPEQIIETNKRLFKEIINKNALMFGAHFPFPALARVSEHEGVRSWRWVS